MIICADEKPCFKSTENGKALEMSRGLPSSKMARHPTRRSKAERRSRNSPPAMPRQARPARACLGDGLQPTLTIVLPGGLLPRPLAIAERLLPFVVESRLPLRRLVDGSGGGLLRFTALRLARGFRRFVGVAQISGQFGMLDKGSVGPTERLRTTPGFAMVAAMTTGSWLSLAAPWWKRLLSAPKLPGPLFIDRAAIA
jgi:hypothetical protein